MNSHSLRSIWEIGLCLALLFLVGFKIRAAQHDDAIDTTLKEMGAFEISRDATRPKKPIVLLDMRAASFNKKQMNSVLPHLYEVKEINLTMSTFDDEIAKSISSLQNIQVLYLAYTSVTDLGLTELSKLRALRKLDLTGTKITDKGLESVVQLPKLEDLWLGSTSVREVVSRMRPLP